MKAIVQHARNVVAEKLYGDLEYYCQMASVLKRNITLLADHVEEQDRQIAEMRAENRRLIERLIGPAPQNNS